MNLLGLTVNCSQRVFGHACNIHEDNLLSVDRSGAEHRFTKFGVVCARRLQQLLMAVASLPETERSTFFSHALRAFLRQKRGMFSRPANAPSVKAVDGLIRRALFSATWVPFGFKSFLFQLRFLLSTPGHARTVVAVSTQHCVSFPCSVHTRALATTAKEGTRR